MSGRDEWLTPIEDVTYPDPERPGGTHTFRVGSGGISGSSWLFKRYPELKRSFAPFDSPEGKTAFKRYELYIKQLNATPALARSKQYAPRDSLAPEPDRASWYLPAGTTVTVERELPELCRDATPAVTVRLRDSVWRNLKNLARETSDGRETAGFLFGEQVGSWKPVSVGWVTRMVYDRREDSARFDLEALVQEKGALRQSGIDNVGELGCWHTHPHIFGSTDIGLPSEADLTTWLSAHDFLGRSSYLGLILTAEPHDERWLRPAVHGWVVRRRERTDTAVCEPAIVQTGSG